MRKNQPENLLKQPIQWKYYINYVVIFAVAAVFAILSLTGNIKSTYPGLLEKIGIAIILASSLGMVVSFLGELSLGHAGFMCIGAFVGGKVASLLDTADGSTVNIGVMLIAIVIGGLAAALFGILIGIPALRLRGDYLAIVTLAFGEIVRSVIMNLPENLFGGTLGLETPRFDKKYLFIIIFAFVLITLAVIQNLLRSKHGRAISSIRDNDIAARAMGINVTKYKLLVFTVSAFFAGIAGVLFSYTQSRVGSAVFDYNYSIEILVMVVLGGIGSINGPIVAATLITYLSTKLQVLLAGDLAVLQNLFFAAILIVIVIYKNAPGLKYFREKHNMKNFFSKIFKKKTPEEKFEDIAEKKVKKETKLESKEERSVARKTKKESKTADKQEKRAERKKNKNSDNDDDGKEEDR